MATALVVPGVRVEARFDVLPPLPAPSGIVGAVGIVDRPPKLAELVGVSKVAELRDLLGPGTVVTMPQVVHALGNGASEVVISAVAGGASAGATLKNRDGVDVVVLKARSRGSWATTRLAVEIRETTDSAGNVVRVSLRLLLDKQVVESLSDLRIAPGEADDLIDTINRQSSYIVALDAEAAGAKPLQMDATFDATQTSPVITAKRAVNRNYFDILPADGVDANRLRVVLINPADDPTTTTMEIYQNGLQERHTGLVMDPDSDDFLPFVVATQSRLVRTRAVSSFGPGKGIPAGTAVPAPFTGGDSPTIAQYQAAIDLLADDTRIDLVLAALESTRTETEVRQVHQALVAHAVAMSDNGAPRIAFGSVTKSEQLDIAKIRDHASAARSRRFALVSPAGAEGAVAGLVGRLNPQDAPTFKNIPLFEVAPATHRESQLNVLLGSTVNACVVQDRRGRGVVVLKGIDTTGDQISVTRVADQAIRETKAIAENFIGQLNSDAARVALKQQIVATFTRMERAGALVPSTDGIDPAFIVDVYSTQQDFAQGIVRIDIAVRPVRSIDYVYATIRVKN